MSEAPEAEAAWFEAALDRYGADLSRWPDGDRATAGDLLARSPAARRMLDAARMVEELLADPVPASPALRRAVLEIPLEEPRPARSPVVLDRLAAWLGNGLRAGTAGAGMALATGLLGFVLGYGQIVTPPGLAADAADQEMLALLGAVYELEELP